METKSRSRVERIKTQIKLVDIIERYVNLQRVSENTFMGLCPFHQEKTPSFKVDNQEGFYYCFGCQAGGDVLSFYQRINGLEFPETLSQLEAELNIESRQNSPRTKKEIKLEFNLNTPHLELYISLMKKAQEFFREQLTQNSSEQANNARKYLSKRNITQELIEKVGIGFAPNNQILIKSLLEYLKEKNIYGVKALRTLFECGLINQQGYSFFQGRITFPIATVDGNILAFNARVTNGQTENKYKNSPANIIFSKKHMLYGLENLDLEVVQREGLVLVEGITDTFGFVKQELNNALVLGSAKLTPYHLSIIHALRPKHLYIVPDNDLAGIHGAISNANKILGSRITINSKSARQENVSIVPINGEKSDPFDLFFTQEYDISRYLKQNAHTPLEFLVKQPLETLIYYQQGDKPSKQFILNNTGNIATPINLEQVGITLTHYEEQKESRIRIEPVSKYILGI